MALDKPILLPDISYSFYPVYCGLYGIESVAIALDDDFKIRIDDYARKNGGIIIANPNAPTGQLLPLTEIERLLAAHPDSVCVIDEAYVDFGGDTAIALVVRYPQPARHPHASSNHMRWPVCASAMPSATPT